MEIKLLPRPFGCLLVPAQIMTLGLVTVFLRAAERRFACRMDEDGVETRAGKRILWKEVTEVRRTRFMKGSALLNDVLEFHAPKARFVLQSLRMANFQELADFALSRVPKGALKQAG